jgi:branched-chain amino acid transport system substrate-binding protein
MFPTSDPGSPFAPRELNAVDLARRELAAAMGTFRPPAGAPPARPLALVACDDARDARRAARHLAEEVRAPAVIGFGTSAEAVDLANSIFIPHGMLVVSSLNMSPLVTSVPQPSTGPHLVWRTTYNTSVTAEALAYLVERVLEPSIRKAAPAERALRVAVLRPKSATGASFSETFFTTLRFNGKQALENGSLFREFTPDLPDPGVTAAELQRFRPHVIAYVVDPAEELVRDVIVPLERSWPSDARVRPYYVTISMLTRSVLDLIGNDAARRHRFFGVTTVSTTAANAQFVMRLNAAFDTKATRTESPNSSYDAFYVIAFASYALGEDAPTGVALARGIARLVPPGESIDVGPANIFRAFGALRSGKNIDLNGATSGLDFDLATGEAWVPQAILCPALDGSGRAYDSLESGVAYDPATRQFQGVLKCP